MNKLILGALICTSAVPAHDTYLMPAKFIVTPGKPLLVSVHNGDSFPASEHATDPSRLITNLQYLRIAGRATHGIAHTPASGTQYLSAETRPRLIVIEAAKFEAYLQEEGLQHISAARKRNGQTGATGREIYAKFAKALVTAGTSDAGHAKPVGLTLEIVPQADPSTLTAGSLLPVIVLFRGKPLPNIQLERAWACEGKSNRKVVGRTDREGRVSIPVDSPGRWRLHAVHMQASTRSDADWESYWASLTFEIEAKRITVGRSSH